MSQISIKNLTFAYEGSYDTIFDNVSFQIDTDWKLGFTGRNGRGKTTFLKLLLGQYEYSGSISADADFEYFPFEVPDRSELTIQALESVCPGLEYWQIARELGKLAFPEEALYRPFDTLSNGEQTKALLAALFLRENAFLLIDEPTNHLDMEGRAVVGCYLKSKSGFILVSHDRAFLDGCVDHILSINRTNIEVRQGSFSAWLEDKARRDASELAENERLRGEICRLKESAAQKADWSGKLEKTKTGTRVSGLRPDRGHIGAVAEKTMKRAKSIEKRQNDAVQEKSALLKDIESAESLKIYQLPYHSSRYALLRDVSVCYDGSPVCENVSFAIERGDRIALCGRNGCGKSSILKLICGENIPHTGTLEKNGQLRISYVAQDTGFLKGRLTDFAEQNGIESSLFLAMLRKLDFSRVQFEKDMRDFSGGQKKKVLLAKSICERSHLLVWDEPLNFVDVLSRIQIEQLLLEYEPTILFVEHDRAFCEKIATKTVRL